MITYEEAAKGITGTLLDEKRMRVIHQYAIQVEHLQGNVYECGVLRGGGALFLRRLFPSRTLRLFDSFEGLPETGVQDNLKKGAFGGGDWFTETAHRLSGESTLSIHKGWLPESLNGLAEPVAFVHLDVDIYSSYRDCLNVLKHRLLYGGVVVCDDYGHFNCPGAKQAVDEFVKQEDWELIRPGTIQAVLIKK